MTGGREAAGIGHAQRKHEIGNPAPPSREAHPPPHARRHRAAQIGRRRSFFVFLIRDCCHPSDVIILITIVFRIPIATCHRTASIDHIIAISVEWSHARRQQEKEEEQEEEIQSGRCIGTTAASCSGRSRFNNTASQGSAENRVEERRDQNEAGATTKGCYLRREGEAGQRERQVGKYQSTNNKRNSNFT
jgi:hypothetical protein